MNGDRPVEPIEWDRPLRHRWGGHSRLGGLEVYFDFDWIEVFRHNRAVFPNGQSLSRLVLCDCPEGKEPCLLLTERTDISARIETTDTRYIVIVPINDYLANAGADAAITYYARMFGQPLTQLVTLSDVDFSLTELDTFLVEHLGFDSLYRWVTDNPERLNTLRRISAHNDENQPQITAIDIQRLENINQDCLEAIGDYLDRIQDVDDLRYILSRLIEMEHGRELTTDILYDQLPERIADTRSKLTEYNRLISDPTSNESDVQRFLETNPWIVGLPYVSARGRVIIPRGEIDFVLDRFDGFFDIVELKGPSDVIVSEQSNTGSAIPPSPSAFTLGSSLSKALAQAHHYRSILDRSRDLGDEYGLSDTRQPWILILIGRRETLSTTGREILRQLNLSLHRVEVIPYDNLGERTEGYLANVEALLTDNNRS